jgi:hypothetical protein
LADLLARRAQHKQAEPLYRQAIESHNRSLALAPSNIGSIVALIFAQLAWSEQLAAFNHRKGELHALLEDATAQVVPALTALPELPCHSLIRSEDF